MKTKNTSSIIVPKKLSCDRWTKKNLFEYFFPYLQIPLKIGGKNWKNKIVNNPMTALWSFCTNYTASNVWLYFFFSEKQRETIEKNYQNWNPKEIQNPKIDRDRGRAGGESFSGGFSIQIQVIWENWRLTRQWSGSFFFEKLSSTASGDAIDRVGVTLTPRDVGRVLNKVWSEAETRTKRKNGTYSHETFKRQSEREFEVFWGWCDVDGTQCESECGWSAN